ncbi:hypothetical protein [Metapseudomonas resinovorans]|uniref:Uncharacterized protein n=1 Tax=Metapseudomonas resinovorans NBRC 106553 TaxID=1245471 RepID=S6AFC3_METRE|nr:hypothetical protein [Pseudomonas resinovorans]BAN48603.1 hypothetical protein PCA10_28710 [Pseudomonas resinovorans NBRC 106553]BAN48615.1 hypothetical protein PCA10_28830 [Pseudomonas resinovorans NBRC 106553]BAN48627.1 hypothetical protein PCA10_28950 [Pseudomonas resinovorans NBRC 106553]
MPFVFLGITRDAGTSKNTQKPYDICQLHYADDASNTSRPDRKAAVGLEGKTIACSPDVILKFQQLPPLSVVNFEFEPDPRSMERNRVCGFKLVKQSEQAA